MDSGPAERDGRQAEDAEPTRTWVRVIDRILWGVNAPVTKAQRARKWKSMGRDLRDAARWISWRS